MKIISKFKDYYDIVLGYGTDDFIKYIRHTKEIPTRDNFLFRDFDGYLKCDMFYHIINVGFCGTIYPAVIIGGYPPGSHTSQTFVVYSIKGLEKAYDALKLDKKLMVYDKPRYTRRTLYGSLLNRFEKNNDYFTPIKTDEPFIKYGVPVFMQKQIEREYRNRSQHLELTLNPRLKDLQFASVVDPFQAYQEIEMYLGGVLVDTSSEMVQISDKNMRDQKGFDEWSFKKHPTKGKKR